MGYLTIVPLVAIVFACFGCSEAGSITAGPYTYEWFGSEARVQWGIASLICKVKGGRLVDIENEAENNIVQTILQENGYSEGVWIGKHGDFQESSLILQENGTYSNWAAGQPSKHIGSKACVQIKPESGEWYTDACNWGVFLKYEPKHPWLCKYGKAPTNSTTTLPMTTTYEPSGNGTTPAQYSTTYEPTGNGTTPAQYSTTYEPTGNGTTPAQYSTTYEPTGNGKTQAQYSTTNEPTGNKTTAALYSTTNEPTENETSN